MYCHLFMVHSVYTRLKHRRTDTFLATRPPCIQCSNVNINLNSEEYDNRQSLSCFLHGVSLQTLRHENFITALHGMQMCMERRCGQAMRKLPVRLSNTWFVIKRKKLVPTLLYHMKEHSSSFCEKNSWWGTTPSSLNFGSSWPGWSENTDFQSIFARSTSAVTPSKKVQLTLIGSPLCTFQRA